MNSTSMKKEAGKLRSTPNGYGRVARFLHWASALLVLVLIGSGFGSAFSSDASQKAAALRVHFPLALLVFLLTLARLIWWRVDHKPDAVTSDPRWQQSTARWTHRGLYLVLIVLLGSGIAMSLATELPLALFGSKPLPDFSNLAPRIAHRIAALTAVALIALHGGAAIYHHWIKKDGTLKRMWSGDPS
ncbi:cytochrome b561 [Cohaesibacter sp. ES.047]|uniref:cytochrome b n=1 Tax=Cohaesibacter sp. ES.047 TaxID=1798205 RepID=UPI000BC08777|nr:cytochrome b/b6 domain-containing protein [Cohaesibacter sp. ES.047]SNY92529.1 cytochrome b561 [Cohaesibacter sp. ES.047]